MRIPPPLDVHAHFAPSISEADVRSLGAFVFAMTRSTAEYDETLARADTRAVWGVGTHPGLVRVNRAFDLGRFQTALDTTPLVGEVGLDAHSRVPMEAQVRVLRQILHELETAPRLVSMHTSGAQLQVLRELHRCPIDGVILHWWTGSSALTEEAIRLGCYFSLPPATMSSAELLACIPLSRVLPETDHPYGDRRSPGRRQPGAVGEVEQRLAKVHGIAPELVRLQMWRNLLTLIDEVGVRGHFGAAWEAVFSRLEED